LFAFCSVVFRILGVQATVSLRTLPALRCAEEYANLKNMKYAVCSHLGRSKYGIMLGL